MPHLRKLHTKLRQQSNPRFIFLAGDSSLDNKHWFFEGFDKKQEMYQPPARTDFTELACNGYESAISPPHMVQDVAYWLNRFACDRLGSGQVVTINASVEESTLADRDSGLLAQDRFISEHITSRDFLVLSVGGNDVALRPTTKTIINMLMLTRTPSPLLHVLGRWAPGMGHFERLFHDRIEGLVKQIVSGPQKPEKVLVCMIYHLDETPGGSWADQVLSHMGYDSDPSKLQYIIETLYKSINRRGFNVPGTTVETFPLFEVLDGKDTADYEQRVEPSVQGGSKMGEALLLRLFPENM